MSKRIKMSTRIETEEARARDLERRRVMGTKSTAEMLRATERYLDNLREYAEDAYTVTAVNAADEYAWFDLGVAPTAPKAMELAMGHRADDRLAHHQIKIYRGRRDGSYSLSEIANLAELA